MRDGALVASDVVPAPVDERVHRAELLEDGRRVDNGHQVVQARHVVEGHARPLVAKGEGLGDGKRLRDPRRLDEDLCARAGAGGRAGEQAADGFWRWRGGRRARRERGCREALSGYCQAAVRLLDLRTWSKRFSDASDESDVSRSSRNVQQMQPFESSIIFSSCCSIPPRRTSSASTLTEAMSLTMTAMRTPTRLLSMWLSSVVLPAPRKPESTVTGSGIVPPDSLTMRIASRTAVYGDGARGKLRHRLRIAAGREVALRSSLV